MMKQQRNRARRWALRTLALVFIGTMMMAMSVTAFAASGLEMSTDYPGLTVKAGDELSFDLDFNNGSEYGVNAELTIASIPDGWEGYFEGSGSEISHAFVKSGSNNSLAKFRVTVPAETSQGIYTIILQASGGGMSSALTLTLDVKEEELGSSAFTTQYAEQEGSAGTSFSFSSTIQNNTPKEQSYSFSSNPPTGWTVTFKPSGESTQVAAIDVDARGSQTMDVTVTPPNGVEAGEYTIPISAISASETLTDELTVVITGTYELDLSTPSGRLSFDANANKKTDVTLSITNNGNVDMQNINLTSSAPSGWTVEFSESSIDVLEASATKEVTAYVTPSEEAMSGDYTLTLKVKNSETSDSAEFRVTVKTETVWGVVGVLLIVIVAAGLWFVFRKFGRR
ncbi:MAG: NEW3 domain-containing protein [Oscillospiraceae bacterium]